MEMVLTRLMLKRGGHTILNLLWMVREMGILRAMNHGSITETGIIHPKNSILLQVDGNLTDINFDLWDGDNDQDGFLNWHEYQAGTEYNNKNETPGLDFGLVAHWKFDETNGTTLHDSSGNDVNGTLVGFDDGWSPGRSGGALRFDGVNDHVSFEGINKLDDIRPFSFSGWIKLDLMEVVTLLPKDRLDQATGVW